jgi:hypothetical protein
MIFLLDKTSIGLLPNGTHEQVFEVLDEIRSTSEDVDNGTLRIDKIFKRRNDSTIEYEQKNEREEKNVTLP